MIDWGLVWIVALSLFVLGACIFWLGYSVGHCAGRRYGFQVGKNQYAAPKEMVLAPYPGDLNAAGKMLEEAERIAREGEDR